MDRRLLTAHGSILIGHLVSEKRALAIEIVGSLVDAIQEYAKDALYAKMSAISEDCWCAGWMSGTEYSLWEIVKAGGGRWGMGEVTKGQAFELDVLYHDAGGWWVWRGEDEEFMPTVEWEKHLEERLGQGDSIERRESISGDEKQANGDIQGGQHVAGDDVGEPVI